MARRGGHTRRTILGGFVALGALLMSAGTLSGCVSSTAAEPSAAVLHLVRHAEKELGRDPALTAGGEARAQALVDALADAPIEVIYSTNYKRTRQTARPIAQARDLPIIYYDPGDLSGFAAKLKLDRRSALIVGHSNTTPQLAEALGGEAGAPITEATEYDRLYRIELKETGVDTRILRYGEPTDRS